MGSAGTGKPPVMNHQTSIYKGSKHQPNASLGAAVFDDNTTGVLANHASAFHTPTSKVMLRSAQAALLEQKELNEQY